MRKVGLSRGSRRDLPDVAAENNTMMDSTLPARIAFLGDYLPRLCGIATFTHDLCEAVAAAAPGVAVLRRRGE